MFESRAQSEPNLRQGTQKTKEIQLRIERILYRSRGREREAVEFEETAKELRS